jgi:hypothetical protein
MTSIPERIIFTAPGFLLTTISTTQARPKAGASQRERKELHVLVRFVSWLIRGIH